ncbi:MAG: bifunctional 5,10-methylenetetrahydrofolate dehydrogenase/5,10-methenyltetrahydrofolate cyclohydrolase [Bacilli bacterium]|nr:bifunctional 5,10-methylenetetrahydrofolate dehydrogenase/5,10-methenyltetrahydrofolate cyclohydrolase [Bacilli bacterium]MDD3422274.1 bifunctional 5,10-methylenetetrahydrofolate dehydrogenase/5,10-methenyltetrahydrofolate cyclohydrolase [Bacilli bacterium]MDD4065663.1 bifunctional 5,10-methylenetetrahydrofolate dehydrogenase/5,10-methenyltetrahydrofolate cyclohydrolase [Bacilli bacterium]
MAKILMGDKVVESLKKDIVKEIKALKTKLTLAIIIPMPDPANASYLRSRVRLCNELGIELKTYPFDGKESSQELIELIEKLNQDASINGIMIDTPFPKHLNPSEICYHIDYKKDVDGSSPISNGKSLQGEWSLIPSTAEGVVELLKYYKIPLAQQKITIVNRSRTVGLPLFNVLTYLDATVTVCHNKTKDVVSACQVADIVVVAIGNAHYFDKKYFNQNSVVIDVGINYVNGICGDVDDSAYEVVKAYSPVPNGVGPVTTICLITNLVKGAKKQVA